MQIRVVTDQPWEVEADVLALPVVADEPEPADAAVLAELDSVQCKAEADAWRARGLSCDGTHVSMHAAWHMPARACWLAARLGATHR